MACLPWSGVVVSLRPISCDSLWWHAARGREVVTQWISDPSRRLLIDETAAEADWLGGAAAYGLYAFGGFNGLFFGKVAIAVAITALILRSGAKRSVEVVLLTALALAVCEPAMMPGGRGLGLLCAVAIGYVLGAAFKTPLRRGASLAAIVMAWANLAPLFCFAAPLVLLHPDPRSPRSRLTDLALVVLAGCASPRGPFAWLDSIRLAAPWLWESQSTLANTEFAAAPWSSAIPVLFVLLALLALLMQAWSSPRGTAMAPMMWLIAFAFGLSSQFTMPLAAIILTQRAVAASSSAEERGVRSERLFSGFASAGVIVVVLLSVSGWIGSPHGLGLGVAAKLEPRLFAQAIADSPSGGAWAMDESSTGIAAWCGLRPIDASARSLATGRIREFQLAVDDLRQGRRNRYWRSDGHRGGWWLWLQSRGELVRWMAASTDERDLLRAIDETAFRPVAIDSPVTPYASSLDPQLAPAIVRTLDAQNIVEFEDWVYPSPNHGGLFVDWPYALGFDRAQRVRQATIFWGMRLPTAALRVLNAPSTRPSRLREACYRDIADREQRVLGTSSRWTESVLGLTERKSSPPAISSELKAIATRYLVDGPDAAIAMLRRDSSAELYALAQLQLETGSALSARATLKQLASANSDDPHTIGAKDVLRSFR